MRKAKYIDLTHAFAPVQPVWPGFGKATFGPAIAGSDLGDFAKRGDEFTYDKHGFIASSYVLTTDQYGTQLDPPAHWNPVGATISDLPPTYAVRPLIVLDIHKNVAKARSCSSAPTGTSAGTMSIALRRSRFAASRSTP